MSTVLILDIPENEGIVDRARFDPEVGVSKVGNYWKLSAKSEMTVRRPESDCRPAVWFSFLGGLAECRVTDYNKAHVLVSEL